MPAPFPAMDPFLEGHVWPDVHHSLGQRPFLHPAIPKSHYLVTLVRGDEQVADFWACNMNQPLVVPVPLKKPDEDIALDLQGVFAAVYEKSFYQLSINYKSDPPPPQFGQRELNWIKEKINIFL